MKTEHALALWFGIVVAALIVMGLVSMAAQAQEAPVCTMVKERLTDHRDIFLGEPTRDSVSGLRGADRVDGRGGSDRLNGGRGPDRVYGGPGDDTLCGGDGPDRVIGGPGNDTIYGEELDDYLIGDTGDDSILGGQGDDRVLGWGFSGGAYSDDGVDTLNGGWNNDRLEAGGADTLYGYTHDDELISLTPWLPPSLLDGGDGNDTCAAPSINCEYPLPE